jgi:hypothetical protein
MSKPPDWLPALVCLEDYGGDWKQYVEAVYSYFKSDFIDSRPLFADRTVRLKRYPLLDGKEAAFWHATSEGKDETQRVPDLRRCERIRWPRPIIEHHENKAIKCWQNRRGKDKRIVLWFCDQDYVVVLADRKKYVLLWTAYYVSYERTRRSLVAEYEDYLKSTRKN